MRPDIATDFDLQFTAPLSAWWLLLLLPLLIAGALWLYRNQYKGVPRHSIIGLTAIRVVLLSLLAILAFRPNLVRRRTLTYAGRVIFLVDDSESMTARDTRMDSALALRIARDEDQTLIETGATYHRLAEHLAAIETEIRGFQKFSADVQRDSDAFWEQRDQMQETCFQHLDEFTKVLKDAPAFWTNHLAIGRGIITEADALDEKAVDKNKEADAEEKKTAGNPDLVKSYRDEAERLQRQAFLIRRRGTAYTMRYQAFKQDFAALGEHARELKAKLQPFISGSKDPGEKAYDLYVEKLNELIDRLREMQAETDNDALKNNTAALKDAVARSRNRPRLELISRMLLQDRPEFERFAGDQHLQFLSLMTGGELENLDGLKPVPGNTEILPRLQALIKEDHDFPLTAVVLLSDGRDLSDVPAGATTQAFSRKRTPIYAAAAGARTEPKDLAVLDVVAPPFAVKGRDVTIRARLKTAVAEGEKIRLQILKQGKPVAKKEIVAVGTPKTRVDLAFKPADLGMFRYQVKLASVPGEAFPLKNNTADFAMEVREEKIKVLFVDWKPRWESRFVLNILRRLSYVELNPIIVVAQDNAQLQRGIERGSWPENLAALEMYDLVILGDLPQDLLTAQEQEDLKTLVTEKGRTLCCIGNGRRLPAAAGELLPATAGDRQPITLNDIEDLVFTAAGQIHPMTSRMAAGSANINPVAAPEDRLRPQAVALVLDGNGRPVLSTRFVGKGKTMLIDTEELWRVLNPIMLESHTWLYINLVSWAVQAGKAESEEFTLSAILRSGEVTAPFQIWARSGLGQTLEALDGDEVVAAAEAETGHGKGLDRFVFENLPARDLVFRVKGSPKLATTSNIIIRHDEELKQLSRNQQLLRQLAADTGGELREAIDADRFFLTLKPRERVERKERIWRLWDFSVIFILIITMLTVEWVWRKFVGLV